MTRGKRLLSLLLSVLMLCTLLPPRASAAPTLYFTAVNDRMCDLNDETMPQEKMQMFADLPFKDWPKEMQDQLRPFGAEMIE